MTVVDATLSREEVAALVCSTLDQYGIEAVLCGGAVVSIYSENEYESFDLDFVHPGLARRVSPAMAELGFVRQGRYWKHSDTEYWVEFPPGPSRSGRSWFASSRRSALAPGGCVYSHRTNA